MALKPSILFYLGHDGNFTIYDPEKDEFVIVEIERTIVDSEGAYSNGKHYAIMKNVDQDDLDLIFNRGIEAAGYKDRTFDYYGSSVTEVTVNRVSDLNTGELVTKMHDPKNMSKTRTKVNVSDIYTNPPKHMFRVNPADIPDHHGCHAFGAYGQSNMDKAWALSYDGGGDDTCFRVTKINSVDDYTFKDEVFDLNGMYNMIAGNYMKRIIATTYSPLDIAGKVMGMAGFAKGKVSQEILDILPVITQTDKEEKFQQFQKELDLGHLKLSADAVKGIKPRFMMEYIEGTGLDFLQKRVTRKDAASEITEEDMENEHLIANTIQVYLEDFMINFIKSNLKEIKKYNNNVILTGGTALNVIANQRLRKEFPQLNFYVPSNPHDGGLSFGALWYLMSKKGVIKRNDYNVTYNGTKILDGNRLERVKKIYDKHWVEASMEDVANVLKDGKILGFVNGTSEVGPRALGNRSILADASYPNIKDIINAKVKRREPYRPFAPVCLLEDAPTYFDSPTFENMEAMQYVVDVKPEYRDKLPAITHIDGTARLQVVEKKNNKVFYDLLKAHGGVLLNTSFNLAGKPILNTYKDAVNMWRNTEMDGLVIIDDKGKINLFL